MPGAGFTLLATHHFGLHAAVKAGLGGSAADHHGGVSVDTIIRAPSCRVTERPCCTPRPCLGAPTAARRALVRNGAAHWPNIAVSTTFPAPWKPPQVSNTMGEKSTPIRPQESALSLHFSPLVVQEGGCATPPGPTSDRVWVEYHQVHCVVPPPDPSLQQDVRLAASVSGDVHLAVMWNS